MENEIETNKTTRLLIGFKGIPVGGVLTVGSFSSELQYMETEEIDYKSGTNWRGKYPTIKTPATFRYFDYPVDPIKQSKNLSLEFETFILIQQISKDGERKITGVAIDGIYFKPE